MNYKLIRISKLMSEVELKTIIKELINWKVEIVLDKGFEIFLIMSTNFQRNTEEKYG